MSVTMPPAVERRPVTHGARVTIARTPEEAEALRPWFDRVRPGNLDADLDFCLTVVRLRDHVLRPHIVLCELPDDRAILIVARVEEQRSRFALRARRVIQVTFGGVVGAESAEDCERVVRLLAQSLADERADAVILPQLTEGGALLSAVQSAAPWWRADHLPRHNVHWRAAVPGTLDEFLAARSSSTRYHVRRYAKRLDKAHGAQLTVREFRDADELEQMGSDIEAVAAKTYQRGLGVGYSGDPLQKAHLLLGAHRGWLRAWVLYLDGTPIAFWFGYCYAGTFCLVATGFDPAYAESRVGQYLQMKMMDSLCADPAVDSFDYGTGEAEYKRKFGDEMATELDILLYAPTVRALRLNASRSARLAARNAVKAWMTHSERGAKVKKKWRKRAEQRAQAA